MSETLAKIGREAESAGMETRIAVLEQIASDTKDNLKEIKENLVRLEEHQRGDFRLLLSAGAAATMALAALMAHGFHWL